MTVGVSLSRLRLPARTWWRDTAAAEGHLLTGALSWVAPLAPVLILVSLVAMKHGPIGLDKGARAGIALGILVAGLLALSALAPRFTRWQRVRFRAILGVELAPSPPTRLLSRRTVRQAQYHGLAGLFVTVASVASLACLFVGLEMIVRASSKGLSGRSMVAAIVGLLLVWLSPWLARGAAAVDVALARALLQPSGGEVLALRVESLSASRAGVVDAADAERRRIERNLHDGTQQRLVSLAMNLGLTRVAVRDADPAVRDAVDAAHEEAKQALVELRDFIRGLHPAILDEQGLDAALSGIAARSPVPVRLSVDLPERPPPAVEAVAYFVVSEALTNAARHAGATTVDVAVRQHAGQVAVSVTDDGRGGADPAIGTGLRGLRQRVESVDGSWMIVSPAGGPTTIMATLPCGS